MPFITAEQVVSTALGLLIRDLALPRTVWRDPVGRIVGAKDDTVSVRLPAYAPARMRILRSGTTRTKDALHERKVDLTLDIDIYKDVGITDEQMNLDIADFGAQVLQPITIGIVDRIGTELTSAISGATYANEIAFSYASDDAWDDLIVPARELLNKAHVPNEGRTLAVGSAIESALLKTQKFVEADKAGTTDALTEATLGRKAGFLIVSAPDLDPDEAFAYHRTAYALTSQAPDVPAGAAWGAVRRFQNFAMRVVQGFDLDEVEDRVVFDSWLGVDVVTDEGFFDANGVWLPSSAEVGAAVTLATSAAADDIIDTTTAHGFVAGDEVVFPSLTGGAGLTAGQIYYVVATSLGAQTFRVTDTPGGSAIGFTTDITAGTVRLGGNAQLVRAVKIVGS